MEERINVAELLKDCPKGMELDCTMYKSVILDEIKEDNPFPILIKSTQDGAFTCLNQYGCFTNDKSAKCVIFPKGKTSWEGFQRPFKEGDVVYTNLGSIVILKNRLYDSYCGLFGKSGFSTNVKITPKRLATEEEKAKLFQAIKDNGYKWNPETKTLEKLITPKFKVGDVIQDKKDSYKVKITDISVEDEIYGYESVIAKGIGGIRFDEQDEWELVPNKFDIDTLVPFESRVLVRDTKESVWIPAIWGCRVRTDFYVLNGTYWKHCIPYEGNQHLRGKTDNCDDFYKNWEE